MMTISEFMTVCNHVLSDKRLEVTDYGIFGNNLTDIGLERTHSYPDSQYKEGVKVDYESRDTGSIYTVAVLLAKTGEYFLTLVKDDRFLAATETHSDIQDRSLAYQEHQALKLRRRLIAEIMRKKYLN